MSSGHHSSHPSHSSSRGSSSSRSSSHGRSHHPSSSYYHHSGSSGSHRSSSGSSRYHSSSSHHHYHEEDRLGRSWRQLASSVVMSFQKAEKAAAQKVQPPPREVLKELDDAVVHFLRNRVEWTRQISHIEAKLQGKQQEMETLDCYMKTQPRFGRKRKREEDHAALDSADAAALAAVDATAAAANFAEKEEPNITVIE